MDLTLFLDHLKNLKNEWLNSESYSDSWEYDHGYDCAKHGCGDALEELLSKFKNQF